MKKVKEFLTVNMQYCKLHLIADKQGMHSLKQQMTAGVIRGWPDITPRHQQRLHHAKIVEECWEICNYQV